MILLVIGGSGSGKSAWAESVIAQLPAPEKYYLATMQSFDQESRARVIRHREQRAGKGLKTIECPLHVAEVPVERGSAVLLEDLPNLLANEMFGGGNWERIVPDLRALSQKCAHLVMVTGHVFSDGVFYPESTRTYIRRLAEINAAMARMADAAAEVVYSIPVMLKGAVPCG